MSISANPEIGCETHEIYIPEQVDYSLINIPRDWIFIEDNFYEIFGYNDHINSGPIYARLLKLLNIDIPEHYAIQENGMCAKLNLGQIVHIISLQQKANDGYLFVDGSKTVFHKECHEDQKAHDVLVWWDSTKQRWHIDARYSDTE